MSIPRRRPDLSSDTPPDRPPIWVNGRQRPSFDLRAYGAYSLIATRAALGPALVRFSTATAGLQVRVAGGAYAVNTERLGRAADYLPKRSQISAGIGGVAGLVQDAARIVDPLPAQEESLAAYDALWRSRPVPNSGRLRGVDLDQAQADPGLHALRHDQPLRPRRPVRPTVVSEAAPDVPAVTPDLAPLAKGVRDTLLPVAAPAIIAPATAPAASAPFPSPDSDTLLAIRDLMGAAGRDDTVPGDPIPGDPPLHHVDLVRATPTGANMAPPVPVPTHAPRPHRPMPAWAKLVLRHMRHASAFVLAWGLTGLVMPVGLVKAAMAHLEGRDLRDLVQDP